MLLDLKKKQREDITHSVTLKKLNLKSSKGHSASQVLCGLYTIHSHEDMIYVSTVEPRQTTTSLSQSFYVAPAKSVVNMATLLI